MKLPLKIRWIFHYQSGTGRSTLSPVAGPIVIVFDNAGYSVECLILDGSFNDMAPWNSCRNGELLGPARRSGLLAFH